MRRHPINSASVVPMALALLIGCGEPPAGEVGLTGESQSRIVGGSSFDGLPAVGAFTYYGSEHCTGTLVGPRKVLTAAHCLVGINKNRLRFIIGASVFNPQYDLRVADVFVHPDYDANAITDDIGYAILSQDAPVEPMGVVTAMDSSWVGESFFFVGYGVTDGASQQGAGYKRAVWMQLSGVESTTFRYDDPQRNTCNGDSGGPAFHRTADGTFLVAGVTSWGDWACRQFGVDTRVDAYLTFLGLSAAPAPVAPPPAAPPVGGCGAETWAGRCDGDTVVWCESDNVYQQNCTTTDKACGWSEENGYYGCLAVAAPVDPCNGETYAGRCDGDTVIWCESEQVQSIQCQGSCGWDGSGGYYNCF